MNFLKTTLLLYLNCTLTVGCSNNNYRNSLQVIGSVRVSNCISIKKSILKVSAVLLVIETDEKGILRTVSVESSSV